MYIGRWHYVPIHDGTEVFVNTYGQRVSHLRVYMCVYVYIYLLYNRAPMYYLWVTGRGEEDGKIEKRKERQGRREEEEG